MTPSITLGVISDTHIPHMAREVPRALAEGMRAAGVDVVVHCGDILEECAIPLLQRLGPLEAVAGNNDSPALVRRYGYKKILEFGAVRIGVVHGHGAPGRSRTPDHAFAQFAGESVHAVLFGHSHVPLCEWRDGILLFNPGSATDKRRQPQYSYGIIRIQGDVLVPELRYYDRKS